VISRVLGYNLEDVTEWSPMDNFKRWDEFDERKK
jgi:hypothetical protein